MHSFRGISMRRRIVSAIALLLAVVWVQSMSGASRPLPIRGGRPVVAEINEDPIFLDELLLQVESRADRPGLRQGRGTAHHLELLERLITIRLITQEAATMGLDELPEIRKQVEVASREILREVLFERLVSQVKAEPAAVEKLFRDMVREWRTASLLFHDEAAARQARKEIEGGKAFGEVAASAVARKAARTEGDDGYHPKKDYLPPIGEALTGLRVGEVSPVIALPAGFVIVRVVDIRYPENAEARAEARREALRRAQVAALKAHEEALRRRHAVVNKAVLASIDYTAAQPGTDGWLEDTRIVAEIKGAPPVTVGDLTDYLRMQFFHGTEQAKQRKDMNAKKEAALEATLGRRLLNMEAQRLGIDRTNAYRDRVNGYRDSLVFDLFVQRVIVPLNKMKEEDVRQYYSQHPREYSYPELVKLRSLAFTGRTAAENAARKLSEGADYGWVAENADGQVPNGTAGLLTFDARPVTTDSLPEGVQKAIAGTRAGEYRLYASPEGHVYLLGVQQVIEAAPKPYDEVKQAIAKKLYGERLTKSIEDYAGKLRVHSTVTTYLTKVQ